MEKIAQKGFTLIEVLLAIVIISIAFTAFFVSLQSINKNQSLLTEKTFSIWVAENVLNEIIIGSISLPERRNDFNGAMTMGNINFKFKVIREKTEDSDVNKITVSVYGRNAQLETVLQGFQNAESSKKQ